MEKENKFLRFYDAIRYYNSFGFEYIETPWIIDNSIIQKTLPQDATPFKLNEISGLVGSAEQSFLSLISDGTLSQGRYQSFSPCFRDDYVDRWHKKYFLKLELIDTKNVTNENLQNILLCSLTFFRKYDDNAKIISTTEGYDIVSSRGIELGSYGIREDKQLGKWIYGTGLAEPRLEAVLEHNNE